MADGAVVMTDRDALAWPTSRLRWRGSNEGGWALQQAWQVVDTEGKARLEWRDVESVGPDPGPAG